VNANLPDNIEDLDDLLKVEGAVLTKAKTTVERAHARRKVNALLDQRNELSKLNTKNEN
jgi:hypothetical protein